jgi:hypothetical protein
MCPPLAEADFLPVKGYIFKLLSSVSGLSMIAYFEKKVKPSYAPQDQRRLTILGYVL